MGHVFSGSHELEAKKPEAPGDKSRHASERLSQQVHELPQRNPQPERWQNSSSKNSAATQMLRGFSIEDGSTIGVATEAPTEKLAGAKGKPEGEGAAKDSTVPPRKPDKDKIENPKSPHLSSPEKAAEKDTTKNP